jgi:hypothetical protein
MQIKTIAYAAGIVDGEGCLTLNRRKHRNGEHSDVYQCMVSVTNNSERLLYWLQKHFGGAVCERTGHSYEWRLYRITEQEAFLTTILPYLLVKEEQAHLLLEIRSLSGKGQKLSPAVRKRRFQIYHKIQSLNGAAGNKRASTSTDL